MTSTETPAQVTDDSKNYEELSGARAQIHYWRRRDAESPRLAVTFQTCYADGGGFKSLHFDIDVIETIQREFAAATSPFILPVIRHWETLVRLYANHRQPHEGHDRYVAARRLLEKVSKVALEKAERDALPHQYALRNHVELAGRSVAENVVLDDRNLNAELCRLGYVHSFMKDDAEYASEPHAGRRYKLIERELHGVIAIYERSLASRLETSDQTVSVIRGEEAKRAFFEPEYKVLEYFKECLDWYLNYKQEPESWMARRKCVLLKTPEPNGDERDCLRELEYSYLAWRLKMSYKAIALAYADKRLADHIAEFNKCFSSRTPPEPSDIPEAPFTYPDVSLIRDEFDIDARFIFFRGDHIDVVYRDEDVITQDVTKCVTLVLSKKQSRKK